MTSTTISEDDLQSVTDYVLSRGMVFEPWQIAAFVTAVRVKPFVILAGISGTGKTQLPHLVAAATGAELKTVAVRPDWTDSSDLIGFTRLNGRFFPGPLLKIAQQAELHPQKQFFLLLDEMNIARVEYYLAEVLSLMERVSIDGSGERLALAPGAPRSDQANEDWSLVGWPPNLCIVGSVNMDETTFGFSRKVLDRSFVIEFSDVALDRIGAATSPRPSTTPSWPSTKWAALDRKLASHPQRDGQVVREVVSRLIEINDVLKRAQLQFGYRLRDEVCLFCLEAANLGAGFSTSEEGVVDPLDLAVSSKILPRIQGGGTLLAGVISDLLDWANGGSQKSGESESLVRKFPMVQARLEDMQTRMIDSGFTTYWK